jgi:hypothetical protein
VSAVSSQYRDRTETTFTSVSHKTPLNKSITNRYPDPAVLHFTLLRATQLPTFRTICRIRIQGTNVAFCVLNMEVVGYRATKLHGITFCKTAPPSRQPLNVVIGLVSVVLCRLSASQGAGSGAGLQLFELSVLVCLFVIVTCIAMNISHSSIFV